MLRSQPTFRTFAATAKPRISRTHEVQTKRQFASSAPTAGLAEITGSVHESPLAYDDVPNNH